MPGLIAASTCTRTPESPRRIAGKLDPRNNALGDRERRAPLRIPVDQDRVLDLRQSLGAHDRRPLFEERLILEPDHRQVDSRADRLDSRGQLVARLIALDEELAGVEHDVGVGQNSLAVDDDPRAAGVLRAVLGPRMSHVRIPHRRADLHDRFADLAFLGIALGRILRLEPDGRTHKTGRRQGRESHRPRLSSNPKSIVACSSRGSLGGCSDSIVNDLRPARTAPTCDQTRSIRPGDKPASRRTNDRSMRNRDSSYPLPARVGREQLSLAAWPRLPVADVARPQAGLISKLSKPNFDLISVRRTRSLAFFFAVRSPER